MVTIDKPALSDIADNCGWFSAHVAMFTFKQTSS
jgi:hypothetical protein